MEIFRLLNVLCDGENKIKSRFCQWWLMASFLSVTIWIQVKKPICVLLCEWIIFPLHYEATASVVALLLLLSFFLRKSKWNQFTPSALVLWYIFSYMVSSLGYNLFSTLLLLFSFSCPLSLSTFYPFFQLFILFRLFIWFSMCFFQWISMNWECISIFITNSPFIILIIICMMGGTCSMAFFQCTLIDNNFD